MTISEGGETPAADGARFSVPGLTMGLVTLIAFNLRSVMLAAPPVLPLIRSELHLSFTVAGSLTSLPVLCLGAAAIPGALLANRLGPRRLIGFATLGIAAGGVVRLAAPPLLALFAGTIILSLCAAVAQPAASAFLRASFPTSVQSASVIYTGGLNAGGVAATTLTAYLLVFGGWRGIFVIWAIPALLAAVLWFWLAPTQALPPSEPNRLGQLVRDRGVWRATGLFAAQSVAYYTAITWIPFLLQREGRRTVALVLLAMGLSVVAVTVSLASLRRPFALSRAFYLVAGTLALLGALGFAAGITRFALEFAILLGVGSGLAFTGSMALPPLLAKPGEVASYSSLMLTAGYALAFLGPFIGGLLLDATGSLTAPFWMLVIAALAMMVVGGTVPSRRLESGQSTRGAERS